MSEPDLPPLPDTPPARSEEGQQPYRGSENVNWAAIGMVLAVVMVSLVFGIVS